MGKHQDVVPFIDATPRSFRSRLGDRVNVPTHRAPYVQVGRWFLSMNDATLDRLRKEAAHTARRLRNDGDRASHEVANAAGALLAELAERSKR